MTSATAFLLVAGAVVVIAVVLVARARRANDGVDSFRRQIDALSPEARRPVVDQVKDVAERQHTDEPADPDDEDGVRGT